MFPPTPLEPIHLGGGQATLPKNVPPTPYLRTHPPRTFLCNHLISCGSEIPSGPVSGRLETFLAEGVESAARRTVLGIGSARQRLPAPALPSVVGGRFDQGAVQLAPAVDLTQNRVGERAVVPGEAGL